MMLGRDPRKEEHRLYKRFLREHPHSPEAMAEAAFRDRFRLVGQALRDELTCPHCGVPYAGTEGET